MKIKATTLSLSIIFFSSLVTAGPVEGLEQLANGLKEVIMVLIQFISDTIFDINSFDELLFAKILLFSIILLVVYTVIKENAIFGGTKNKPIQWIISSAIAILSIRYLSDDFIQAILLQYGTLAVGITVFLPLMIYFFFIHQSGIGPFGRRVGWIVFAASFFALWSLRDDLGNANWIYWIAILFVVISIFFDKSIHRYFSFADFRKAEKRLNEKAKWALEDHLDTLREKLEQGRLTPSQFENRVKEIHDKIKALNT